MDVECYLAEKMMRERMAEARANAEVARLLRASDERSGRYGVRGRLTETGRSLAKTARKVAFAISSVRNANRGRRGWVVRGRSAGVGALGRRGGNAPDVQHLRANMGIAITSIDPHEAFLNPAEHVQEVLQIRANARRDRSFAGSGLRCLRIENVTTRHADRRPARHAEIALPEIKEQNSERRVLHLERELGHESLGGARGRYLETDRIPLFIRTRRVGNIATLLRLPGGPAAP